jgi:DNA-binding NtrC family response regulator
VSAPAEVVRVLALDDEIDLLKPLKRLLADRGFDLVPFFEVNAALDALRTDGARFDVILLDRFLAGGVDGLDVLVQARKIAPDLPVVMLSGDDSGATAAAALKAGAFYYLTKPVEDLDIVALTLTRAAHHGRLQQRARQLEQQVVLTDQFEHMVGASAAMREVFATIAKVAETDVGVLIQGESGTGKELAARALHNRSARARGPFVALNCGAIPETLIDSELFGHARGAFTGATEARNGMFVEAHGGTVFLDEIGEMPLQVQQRLLRVLQEREVRPLGGSGARNVDVRVIAASHVDLEDHVNRQRFRADLFYRLNVVAIRLPALRERLDDLPVVAHHLFAKHAARMNRTPPHFSVEAMEALSRYDWPGNVRELENVVQRALALSHDIEVPRSALPPALLDAAPRTQQLVPDLDTELAWSDEHSYTEARQLAAANFEKRYFLRQLQRAGGNVNQAARLAGIDKSNFRRALARLGITPDPTKQS